MRVGTNRSFRLREVVPTNEKGTRAARTYNIPLPHNSVGPFVYACERNLTSLHAYPLLQQLTIMHASCQEMFKHAIPPQRTIDLFHPPYPPPPDLRERILSDPSNARINITFRFFRPDYKPSNTPRCKCGIPCYLRPDMKNRYSLPMDDDDGRKQASGSTNKEVKSPILRRDAVAKYWWTCHAGAQNDGKGCGIWRVMDAKEEGRGPFAGDV